MIKNHKFISKRSYKLYFFVLGALVLAVIISDYKTDKIWFNELSQYFIVFAVYLLFVLLSLFTNSDIVISAAGIKIRKTIGKSKSYNWNDIERIEMCRIRSLQFNVILKSGLKIYHNFITMSKKEFVKIASILYINNINVSLEGNVSKSWKSEARIAYLNGELPTIKIDQ